MVFNTALFVSSITTKLSHRVSIIFSSLNEYPYLEHLFHWFKIWLTKDVRKRFEHKCDFYQTGGCLREAAVYFVFSYILLSEILAIVSK